MNSIEDYYIIADAIPHKRTGTSRKIPLPNMKDTATLSGLSNKYADTYKLVLSELNNGVQVGFAYDAVGKKLGIGFGTISKRTMEVKEYLQREMEKGFFMNVEPVHISKAVAKYKDAILLVWLNLTLSDIEEIEDTKLILVDPSSVEYPEDIVLRHWRVYTTVFGYLLNGETLLDAYNLASKDYNTSWNTVQNYFVSTKSYLLGVTKERLKISSDEHITNRYLVTENIYKDFITGLSIPNIKTNRSKEVLYPVIDNTQILTGLSSKHLAIYMRLIDKIREGKFIGFAIPEIAEEFKVSLSNIDGIVPKIKDALLLLFTKKIEMVMLRQEIEETTDNSGTENVSVVEQDLITQNHDSSDIETSIESVIESTTAPSVEPILEPFIESTINRSMKLDNNSLTPPDMDMADFIKNLVVERDFYRTKCIELQRELEMLYTF
jgi:hypothetical protein